MDRGDEVLERAIGSLCSDISHVFASYVVLAPPDLL